MALKKIVLAKPRGFCAGVVRAVEILEQVLALYPPPVYVRKEIVHNQRVVRKFKEKGVIFVDILSEVPDGQVAVFSAHGVSPQVREEAKKRNLKIIDATCPLVTKVHLEAVRFAREGYTLLFIGHRNHEEVEGTMGEAPESTILVTSVEEAKTVSVPQNPKLVYLTQTTLSVDDTKAIVSALKQRFPHLQSPPKDDICYATQNRQNAVKELTARIDILFVLGAQNSSNSRRLAEVAAAHDKNIKAYLVDNAEQLKSEWLNGVETAGVTAGASAPEELVEELLERLKTFGENVELEEMDALDEHIHFALPLNQF